MDDEPLVVAAPSQAAKNHLAALTEVREIAVARLHENPLNSELFGTVERGALYEKLREDIRARGIIVPLIARKDGTLLAGHNRLAVARELGFPTVPVQIVNESKSPLNDTDVRAFIIKDNLLRRHLTNDRMIEMYRMLYPNFDADVLAPLGGRPGTANKRLTATQIAADTGQNVEAVRKQLQKHRNGESKVKKEALSRSAIRGAIRDIITLLEAGKTEKALRRLEELEEAV